MTRLLRRPAGLLAVAAAVVVLGVLMAVFQPWKAVLDRRVDEAAPGAAAGVVAAPEAAPSTAPAEDEPDASAAAPPPVEPPPVEPPPVEQAPVVLASGDLISHEHTTTGSVQVLGLADGSRVLRLEDLDTSDGPVLRVWLTDAPVIEGRDGWGVFDDGRYADLGELKGNTGSQNYPVPADVDLAALSSLSIWCDRFDVSFGAAALTLA